MRFGDYLIGHCAESINNGNIRLPKLVADLVDAINGLEEHLAALSDKLEHLSTRVEGMSVKALVETLEGLESGTSGVTSGVAKEEPKHPLEDYQITEKDVGSLVQVTNLTGESWLEVLKAYEDPGAKYWVEGVHHSLSKPALDPICLHFKPHYATNPGVVPPGLLDGNPDAVAVLWDDGDITVEGELDIDDEYFWSSEGAHHIIGYRPLFFVNPLEDK